MVRSRIFIVGGAVTLLGLAPAAAVAGQADLVLSDAGTSTFVVPAGVTSVNIAATGGAGGSGDHGFGGAGGGRGALVSAPLPVTAGESLGVAVGVGGGDAAGSGVGPSGAGGGYSGVFRGGTPVLIAGGGGGGGGFDGAGGGGDAGAAGASGKATGDSGGGGGGPGTASAGGGGGVAAGGRTDAVAAPAVGAAGRSLLGGAGGAPVGSQLSAGGGGGGGYFGGGGGGAGVSSDYSDTSGGGGGGSNYTAGLEGVTTSLVSASPSVELVYNDPVAPDLELAPPVAVAPATIDGVAGTDQGDSATVELQFFKGAAVAGLPDVVIPAQVGPGGAYSASPAALPDGTWTVRVTQRDLGGNVSTTASYTITIDTVVPAVRLIPPAAYLADATPRFSGTYGTADGDEPAVNVTLRSEHGTTTTLPATLSGGSFTATPAAPLADGAYTVRATQVDQAHNLGVDTEVFVIDTVAPVLTIDSSDAATGGSTTLTGTAGVEPGDLANVTVQVRRGDALVDTRTATASSGAWSMVVPLADGVYTATAVQKDAAGNVGTTVQSFRVGAEPSPVPSPTPTSTPSPAPTPTPALNVLSDVGTPVATPVSAPIPVPTRATAAFVVTKAAASRRRGVTTLKLNGTATIRATGVVVVAIQGVTKSYRVTLSKGKWSASIKITGKTKSLNVTAHYLGDASFLDATATNRVKVRL